jgi:hypothetical protein
MSSVLVILFRLLKKAHLRRSHILRRCGVHPGTPHTSEVSGALHLGVRATWQDNFYECFSLSIVNAWVKKIPVILILFISCCKLNSFGKNILSLSQGTQNEGGPDGS